jgi:sialic acid synthase SpsE|tara:strand:- start:149 stop:1147 length:999 start_codon:yes stop_codon:yes gene_type:complete
MSVFVIAEAGANHNRDFKQAKILIDIAVGAGANAVKFQTYSSETLYSKNTPDFAGYKNINKLIKEIELPRTWQKDLKMYCDDNGIEFMSTPFDEAAVEELVSLGVKRLKIAGFESTDPRFVKMVASAGLPIIASAGIGNNLLSIGDIIQWVSEEQKNPDITILHCNNAYPTPDKDINLNRIESIKEMYEDIKVGLSDHTEGILAPSLAVAKGATCIEKHYTISKRLYGPDHPFALEPEELNVMIKNIRLSEKMCKDTESMLTDSESRFSKAMRSVVTTRNVEKGEILTQSNTTTKRPFLDGNIHASKYYSTLGAIANKKIAFDDFVTEKDIE